MEYNKYRFTNNANNRDTLCASSYLNLYLQDIGKCDIIIYPEENDIAPHMHIISEDRKFETCICLLEPKYYKDHKFNIQYLNDIQIIQFITYMNIDIDSKMNNWLSACFCWKIINKNIKNLIDIRMPDYILLKEDIK